MRLLGAIEDLSLAPPRKQSAAAQPQSAAQTTAAQTAAEVAVLVELYAPLLFRIAHSVLRSPAEAEDVVQDTFVRVLEHRTRLPQNSEPIRDLRVWLIRIAWNLALDRKRRIRPDQMDPGFSDALPATLLSADQQLAGRIQIHSVFREIDRLPKKERAVLLLSALDELSTPELAAVLGKSESAIRALLFRARTRLRERLEKGSSR